MTQACTTTSITDKTELIFIQDHRQSFHLKTGSSYKHANTHIYMIASEWIVTVWNKTRPRAPVLNKNNNKGVKQGLKHVTQTQQQRPKSSTVTFTWCVGKYHKLHQRYILKRMSPSSIYTLYFRHTQQQACISNRQKTIIKKIIQDHTVLWSQTWLYIYM